MRWRIALLSGRVAKGIAAGAAAARGRTGADDDPVDKRAGKLGRVVITRQRAIRRAAL
jgi:hypothetical protein